ncbi:interferon-induced protein 44 isoform X1 [Ictalurus punctatus]|uniref:Interferon-induced protein 44 isoform X1 n=1 Tax=Ictalurus punctatus TaxID=7998 RepID=A0A9F7RRU9_ICTPU|nr:interferon-induced protein 44 isoform X1 [Ictalurus punctatus]
MASVVSSLGSKKKVRLQKFFSSPVHFFLLYKSKHFKNTFDQLLSSFDNSGKFLLSVFLKSGSVRGAFMSKSLRRGTEFSDTEAFVFEMDENDAKHFLVKNPAEAIRVGEQSSVQYSGLRFETSQSSDSISFGSCLKLRLDNGVWYVSFCTDMTCGTKWAQEKNIHYVDVELHRVEDVGDVLPNPWREVSWNDETRDNLRKDFVSYKLLLKSLPRVKALLLGPVGSGKSSFINSLRSTMYKRIVHLPNIGTAVDGFTQKMTTYNIRVNQGGFESALSLCDVKAIGDDDSTGLSYSDALAVIKGHIPEGYKFQRGVTVSDAVSGYIENPTLNEQIHCVLFVLDASKVTSYPSSLQSTLKKLHSTISDMGIPQLILLTHVDQVCPVVEDDVKYVYSSRALQDKMKKAAELLGLSLSYVLPVRNYVSQLTVDCNADILLLNVVMSILQAADDTLEDKHSIPVPVTPLTPKKRCDNLDGLFD